MDIKIAAGYIRVSTQEQSQNGLSLESQKRDIEEYCRRNGIVLDKFYVDAGISARKDIYKRESFMEMMKAVEAKKVNHIVVLRLDRFFRNVYDYHRMMNEYLIPAGCGWSAVKEEYNTTTTNGRLMINLRLSIAEQECDQDSERIRDVFANRVREGYIVTGVQPFGFSITEDKRLVPNSDADIVKDIFREYLSSASVRKVLVAINNRYDLSKSYDFYRETLSKQIYIGKHTGNDHYCEPIIDEDTFNVAQQIIASNQQVRSRKRTYIFAGLLRCNRCGRALCGSSPQRKEFTYYKCSGAYQHLNCDARRNTSEKKVEEYLVKNIEALANEHIIRVKAEIDATPVVKSNRSSIEKKIERVKELFINGMISMDEMKSRISTLEEQIVDEMPKKTQDVSHLQSALNGGVLGLYSALTNEKKNAFWRRIVKTIYCDGSEVKDIVFL